MQFKKPLALLLILVLLSSITPINAFAFVDYPYGPLFGKGDINDPVDYKKVYDEILTYDAPKIYTPIAKFAISKNGEKIATSDETEQTVNLFLGDKVNFKVVDGDNLSKLGSGEKFSKFDFQITHKGAMAAQHTTQSQIEASEGFTFNDTGEYYIYYNVMDDTPKDKTDYWGNWSYNGAKKSRGINPGSSSSPDDDFYGWWYYVVIHIIVSPHTLTETHYDLDTGQELNKIVHRDITASTYTTNSKEASTLPGYTYVGSQEGYTWDEASSCPMSDASVTSRTARYGYENYSYNKGSNNAFHWYYYRRLPGLFANFAIKYGGSDFTDKELVAMNLPVAVNLEDLSVGENITSWTWEYKTPEMPAFQQFSTEQNPTMELSEEKTYTFRLTVRNATEQKSITHDVTVKKGNPPPENQPPEAEILGPKEAMAGETVRFDGGNSYDSDGIITQYAWGYEDANFISVNKDGDRLSVWYPYTGSNSRHEYVDLTVTDDKGATGEDTHGIEILPPVPEAVLSIDGIFKENRKVTLDASASGSPSRYPINSYIWGISNPSDVKSVSPLNGNPVNNVIYKTAGTYNNTITVTNTAGLSASDTKTLTIVPDQKPNVDFAVTTKLLRDPNDGNQAHITISNLTSSPDGDPIKKTVMFYSYDSDNDGNFNEETWKYSTDGTTWNNAGIPYAQLRTSFDIYNLAGGNPLIFTLKSSQVGEYKFEAMAIEDIPAADTIPELLSPSDYRRSDTFTSKPDAQKIVDVINTAPTVTFEVKKKKAVDILIATDYTGQKLADLQAALNVQKANLLAKNIDVRYTIVNSTSPVASISDSRYWYRRYGRYRFTADKETWSSSGNGHSYDDEPWEDNIVWEERTALESEAPYLPLRNPSNLTWGKGPEIHEEEPGDSTPDWERWYSNISINVTNDGYRNSGTIEFVRSRVNGLQSSSGMTYGYEYGDIENESVSVDAGWRKDEKIADVTVNVNSVNFASITSAPLRADSDRYILFIGDSNSKIYSGSWGSHYPFGGLTKTEQDYLKSNKIKPYIITPSASLDAIVGPEKALSTIPSIGFTYFKAIDGTMKLLLNDGYPINIDLGAEIKAVYGNYVLLVDNTLKYRAGVANYTTLATNVIRVMQEKNGRDGIIGNENNLWIVTSDGILRQYINGVQNRTFNYPDAVDIYHGGSIAYGDGSYIISRTSGTYFINKTGQIKLLYGAPVSGFKYIDARDRRDGDFVDYMLALIYKNGYVQIWREWIDSSYNYDTGVTTKWIKDLTATTLYQGIYNSTTEKYNYYGFPWVYPTSGMNCIINNGLFEISGISYIYESAARKEYYYIDMTNPQYKATGVSNVVNDVRYFTNGTIGVPCTYYKKTIGYKGSVSYSWVTMYVDVPALHGKTITKVVSGSGATAVFTSGGHMYKWADTAPYQLPALPAFNFTLASNNVGGAYSNTYQIIYDYNPKLFTYNYYWDKSDNKLKKMDDDSVVYSNVVDVQISSNNENLYVVTSDRKIYGQGYFGRTYSRGSAVYSIGDPFHELVKTKIVISDTSKQYITLRDIMNSINTTKYFGAGQYRQAITDITNTYLNDTSYTTNYVLVNDLVSYNVVYNDYENDWKYAENWTYSHEPNYFENSMGLASFHGKTLASPVTKFTRKGRYTINVRARDNPKIDDRFDNYRLWSTGNQNVILYVHEKPVALFRVSITPNGNGTFRVEAMDAGSYDRDHTSRADRGITAREWRWKEKAELNWHNERMNKADCSADKVYTIQLRVRDLEGAWSDYMTVELDADNPPVALFSIAKNPIVTSESLQVRDLSFPQSLSHIDLWHWVIKKYNSEGSLPGDDIQNGRYGTSNAGTGSMAGYDTNVKTDFSDEGEGKYRLYLRVRDSNGLWSDGGTDTDPILDNFYAQDFTVQESFKIENFRVVKVRDLHLGSFYYNPATGRYDDRPMGVNEMAIDNMNFGNMVDGLTKGYLFEFEIDTEHFNEDSDTIRITPRFFTCDNFFRDSEERDLFWEDSGHRILRAGEGGHKAWESIILTGADRIITGSGSATWRGSYLIPGTAWAVPAGTSAANAKASRLNRDIIVNFEIKGYRGEELKYDYNLKQWPLERTHIKHHYEIGDVIRYSHTKNNLEDINVILNRP